MARDSDPALPQKLDRLPIWASIIMISVQLIVLLRIFLDWTICPPGFTPTHHYLRTFQSFKLHDQDVGVGSLKYFCVSTGRQNGRCRHPLMKLLRPDVSRVPSEAMRVFPARAFRGDISPPSPSHSLPHSHVLLLSILCPASRRVPGRCGKPSTTTTPSVTISISTGGQELTCSGLERYAPLSTPYKDGPRSRIIAAIHLSLAWSRERRSCRRTPNSRWGIHEYL